MKTIVLYASPLSEGISVSTKLAKKYLDAYKTNNDSEIVEINLNNESIGQTSMTSAKMDDKTFFTDGLSDKYTDLLLSADHLIVVTSMINFNVPAVLKNFIDHIAVANKTFKYKYDGNGESEGLITNLTVQILATQGAPKGWYPFGDHVAYLEGVFNFLGSKVNKSILVDGTKTKEFAELSIDENLNKYEDEINSSSKF